MKAEKSPNKNVNNKKVDMSKVSPILKFIASVGGKVVLTIVFAAIIYGILMAALQAESSVVLVIVFVICGYFGWKSLNKITPDLFVWMPLASWAIYYLVKGLLAIIIGALIAPIWIGKKISSVAMEYVDVAINSIDK